MSTRSETPSRATTMETREFHRGRGRGGEMCQESACVERHW